MDKKPYFRRILLKLSGSLGVQAGIDPDAVLATAELIGKPPCQVPRSPSSLALEFVPRVDWLSQGNGSQRGLHGHAGHLHRPGCARCARMLVSAEIQSHCQ